MTTHKCGTCGKPRNLLGHTCVTSATSRRKPARSKVKPKVDIWTCGTCGKSGNPLTHTCKVKTDFKSRKAKAARDKKADEAKAKKAAAAARKRERTKQQTAARRERARARRQNAAAARREAARQRRGKTAPSGQRSPPKQPHDYHTCNDADCRRHACLAWKEAKDVYFWSGHEVGYDLGILNCPREHSE